MPKKNNAENRERYDFTVPPELAGIRLDQALVRLAGDVSRTRIQFCIREGYTFVNGEKDVPQRYLVQEGDRIQVDAPVQEIVTKAEPEKIPLDVMYEDDSLLVVNKPAGMVVHPAARNWTGTLVNAVLGRDSELSDEDFPDPLRPGIVHRLDKDTSGALVIAKTPKALRKLSKAFADRDVEKIYLAIVFGTPVPNAAVIRTPYGRSPADRKKMAVLREGDPDAREACTAYRVMKSGKWNGVNVSILQVRLHTGRTHQIRVHMAYKGYPLLGEKLYNKGRVSSAPRQMLHAWQLAFPHPETDEILRFEAPVPEDFRAILDSLS